MRFLNRSYSSVLRQYQNQQRLRVWRFNGATFIFMLSHSTHGSALGQILVSIYPPSYYNPNSMRWIENRYRFPNFTFYEVSLEGRSVEVDNPKLQRRAQVIAILKSLTFWYLEEPCYDHILDLPICLAQWIKYAFVFSGNYFF